MSLDSKLLDHLTREAREAPLPELDWARLEAELPRTEVVRTNPSRWLRRVGWVAALAAAAAVLLLVAGRSEPVTSATVPPAATTVPAPTAGAEQLAGDALAVEQVVVADTRRVVVEHPGIAVWTLEPGSRAQVVERGRWLTVALEAGAIQAEVVPSSEPERFAVEAGETRVAVHGTVFRVVRSADSVVVEVLEGTVAVGHRRDRGHTRGVLLEAPAAKTFAVDGTWMSASEPPRVAHRSGYARPQVVDPLPVAPPSEVEDPLIAEVLPPEVGADEVVERLRRCFVEHTPASKSMRVSATTTLFLTIGPYGTLDDWKLVPPLAPAVEDCAMEAARELAWEATGKNVTLRRDVTLYR